MLAKNKKQETYEDIFEKLLEIEPALLPQRVTVDFELAAINAIKKLFPQSETLGCFFHLQQNYWKKIQSVGLQTRYGNDADFAASIRMVMALAFVPQHVVVATYEALVSTAFFVDDEKNDANTEKQSLLNYFESNYIGSPGRTQGTRKSARFPIHLWNVFEVTIQGNNMNDQSESIKF